jgi:DNA polymerase-3 subunit chi
VADAALLEAIDTALWTLSPTDFVAHCRGDDAPSIVERSPVVLVDSAAGALPDRPILVNLGAELPARFERFERLIDIVGSDDADRQAGRARWRHYKDRGYAIRTHAYAGGANT